MSSGSSSTRLLVPHQSDGNSGLSKPKNYASMLHGHFDTKSSFLSKSTFSTGLPEPELRGVIFSCNGLKLGLMVMVWEELAGVFTISPPPQILHAINTRKYANFNLKEQQQQQQQQNRPTIASGWKGKGYTPPKPLGMMDMFTPLTVVASQCLQSAYIRWYSSNMWLLLYNSHIQLF